MAHPHAEITAMRGLGTTLFAFGIAAGLMTAPPPACAVIVAIEYTGVVNGGEGLYNPLLAGQPYTANYVFDLSTPGVFYFSDSTGEDVRGGTQFGPAHPSPVVSASLTIGLSTITIPQVGSSFGEITAFNNGTTAEILHDTIDATGSIRLLNYIKDGTSPFVGALAHPSITTPFTHTVSGDEFDLSVGLYCYANGCLTFELHTLTQTVLDATTPLPAALPLFAGGLGVIGLLARRRKKEAAALAA